MIKDLLANTNSFSSEEIDIIVKDHDRCRLLASQLKNRRHPYKLVFEGTKTEDDEI